MTENNEKLDIVEAQEADSLAQATSKLEQLLTCGNERVELSAAKEILSIAEAQAAQKNKESENSIKLEVEIRIVE